MSHKALFFGFMKSLENTEAILSSQAMQNRQQTDLACELPHAKA
jgi:hypothetical protein